MTASQLLRRRLLNPHAYPVALALGAAALVPAATLAAPASAPSLAASPVAGQPVSGTVRDAASQPMPGVTIVLKGTTIGTATNANGVFTLDAPADGGIGGVLRGLCQLGSCL